MSHIEDMKKQIYDLQQQADIERITVSKAIEDLIKYVNDHKKFDVLLTGHFHGIENPFQDSKSCSII